MKFLTLTVGALIIAIAGQTLVGEIFSGGREEGAKILVGIVIFVTWFIVGSVALLATNLPDDNTEENHP